MVDWSWCSGACVQNTKTVLQKLCVNAWLIWVTWSLKSEALFSTLLLWDQFQRFKKTWITGWIFGMFWRWVANPTEQVSNIATWSQQEREEVLLCGNTLIYLVSRYVLQPSFVVFIFMLAKKNLFWENFRTSKILIFPSQVIKQNFERCWEHRGLEVPR